MDITIYSNTTNLVHHLRKYHVKQHGEFTDEILNTNYGPDMADAFARSSIWQKITRVEGDNVCSAKAGLRNGMSNK